VEPTPTATAATAAAAATATQRADLAKKATKAWRAHLRALFAGHRQHR
jgi:hypothetical protein